MADHPLMQWGTETMFVPANKVAEFEKLGWRVILPASPESAVAAETVTPADSVPVAEEAPKKKKK
jgi:hypothetical protein